MHSKGGCTQWVRGEEQGEQEESENLTECVAPPPVEPFILRGKALRFPLRIPDSDPSLSQASVLVFPEVQPKLFTDQSEPSQY